MGKNVEIRGMGKNVEFRGMGKNVEFHGAGLKNVQKPSSVGIQTPSASSLHRECQSS